MTTPPTFFWYKDFKFEVEQWQTEKDGSFVIEVKIHLPAEGHRPATVNVMSRRCYTASDVTRFVNSRKKEVE